MSETTENLPAELAEVLAAGYELDFVNLDSLEQHPDNPREGDVDVIAESIRENGFTAPLIVQRPRNERALGRILAGNHRWLAARQVGLHQVPVIWIDVDDVAAAKILLADNRTSDLATNEKTALLRLLKELDDVSDLVGTGFDDQYFKDLLSRIEGFRLRGDEDEVRETGGDEITKRGDLWLLGNDHRLLCGDSTDPDDVARLLDGGDVKLLLTDPPYGIELDHTWRNQMGINFAQSSLEQVDNDDRVDWTEAYELSDADAAIVWHAAWFTCDVLHHLEAVDYEILQQIVWVKERFSMGRSKYHWQHECAWFARKNGRNIPWAAGRDQSTVWEAPSPKHIMSSKTDDKTDHPTQKPVKVYEIPLVNHLHAEELAYDCFGGSGTLVIAAQKTGRRSATMELAPKWCDLICRRFMDLTGEPVVNADTGEAFPVSAEADADF